MRSLIVVSNRLPFVVKTNDNGNLVRTCSAGGLVTALTPLVIQSNGYWIGWAGKDLKESMEVPESNDENSIDYNLKSSQIIPIFYSDEVFDWFYNGMCNATLWPLMHSLTTNVVYKSEYWNAYMDVNKCYANAACEVLKKNGNENNLVWIHDYHLLTMPLMLKNLIEESSLTSKIAFFLHIPFPSWDIFRLIPWANEILFGLLGCDLIAFHTNTYAINFLDSCSKLLGLKVDKQKMLVENGNKTVVIRAFPIGIPYEWFQKSAKISPKSLNLKEKIILGVDRLDYTKGIIERINGFERFLEKYPEYLEQVVFVQVAVPSRTEVNGYKILKDELEREIGRVCGRFATLNWTPIKYIYKNLPQFELTGYYRDAAVGLVTAVRDGMNLVAKEYVACQVNDPGVLIISPFTGAGETMSEAITVNPLEKDILADSIKCALDMPYDERKSRMNALQSREKAFCLNTWLESFFEACDSLNTVNSLQRRKSITKPITVFDFENWLDSSIKDNKLTVILDYDGTLVPLQTNSELAVLSDDIKELLEKLVEFSELNICVLSGRSLKNLKQMVPIKNIHLAGSHGMEISLNNITNEEVCEQAFLFKNKVSELAGILKQSLCQYGGWIEEKVYHVVFHWEDVLPSYKQIAIQKAKEIMQKNGFQPQLGHFCVEAKPPIGWDKGQATFKILEKLHGIGWSNDTKVIFIGHDETDEDAIRGLAGLGITFRISKTNVKTFANYRLPNSDSVKTFLEWLLKHMMNKNEKLHTQNETKEKIL